MSHIDNIVVLFDEHDTLEAGETELKAVNDWLIQRAEAVVFAQLDPRSRWAFEAQAWCASANYSDFETIVLGLFDATPLPSCILMWKGQHETRWQMHTLIPSARELRSLRQLTR